VCPVVDLLVGARDADKPDDKPAADLTDPVEILKKADAACKALKSIKYEVAREGEGDLAARVARLQAEVIQAGASPGGEKAQAAKFVIDARYARPGQSEIQRVTAGSDAETFFVIEHAKKLAHEDIDPAVMGVTGSGLVRAMFIEFMHTAPFNDEIIGKSRELKGSKAIGGVDCYEVHVVYQADEAPAATWFFAKTDFLPRCRVDEYKLPDGTKGLLRKTITKLEADPKLPDDAFKLKLPEGYTKTDDFAP